MKRTEKRERTTGLKGRNSALLSVHGRAFLTVSMAVALGVSIGTASGCRSLFQRGYEDGRYLNGVDATSDWERARMENSDDSANTASARRSGASTARGAEPYPISVNGSENSEKKSWTDNFFHWPSFSTKNRRELELESELELSERRQEQKKKTLTSSRQIVEEEAPLVRNDEAVVSSSRSLEPVSRARTGQKGETTGFWGKLFPSHKTNDSDADSDLIVIQRRKASSGSATVDGDRRVNKKAGVMFGGVSSFSSKPWNRPNAVVEQYQQTRFLPSMKTITRYYSTESVKTDRRLHARSESFAYGAKTLRNDSETLSGQRGVPERPHAVEKTASLPAGSYRSNSYAPQRFEETKEPVSNELPASPATNRGYLERRGAASLSPIAPRDQESAGITQTSGSTRMSGLGKTRPIASAVPHTRGTGVYSTSFTGRQSAADPAQGVELSPEALFGWNEETFQILESLDVRYYNEQEALSPMANAGKRDVDESFRNSLGAQKTYDWFDSEQNSASVEALREQPGRFAGENDSFADARLDEPGEYPMTSLPVEENETRVENDSNELSVLNVDRRVDAPLDDSSWLGSEKIESLPEQEFAGNESQTLSNDGEIDTEQDLDSIVDGAIAHADFLEPEPEPVQKLFATSTVSGGSIATDLADAIMESVSVDDPIDSKAVALDNKASVLSEAAPDTLNTRKTEQVAAPLTQEEIAWIEQVKNAIRSLLVEREEHKRRGDDVRICDARLRLLYLVIGEYERSIQEIQDESDPLRNFWEKECRGLETLLQNQLEEIDPTFVAERLRSGLDTLSGLCKMRIRKLLLVEEPAGYGLFEERVEPYERGEALYAYAELDYVTSRETDEGFSIDVECRWRLLSSDGTPLTSFETQRCKNLSETKLRDVVLNVSVPLPEDLEFGACLLELEVRDLNAARPETCVERLTVRVVDGALSAGYVVPATSL